ncbi:MULTISPECIES: SDR family NAD(P)-dependent oxidoreductase [unclassified Haladaptatus]|uniref:SDR family NAD(P)-dependent oxidoreductase n=1 Tax=unclassified Haladaptatus TaxID=2622732 RepID=UPI002FCE002D
MDAVMEQFDLTGRVAVVTGGSRGIGRAIALGLADAGAAVVPAARTEDDVANVAQEIRDRGGEALAATVDVTDEADIRALMETAAAEFGGIDCVVNNAGVNPGSALGEPEHIEADGLDFVIDVNLRGAFLCTKAAAEYLHESDGGSVINVASVGGLVGLPRQHPYVASKHGLVGITKSMALDWAPTVRVNAIAPGYVDTDLTEGVTGNDKLAQSIRDRTPLDRFADPEELAGPAVFLASRAASYVTGECLAVDGGWTAR